MKRWDHILQGMWSSEPSSMNCGPRNIFPAYAALKSNWVWDPCVYIWWIFRPPENTYLGSWTPTRVKLPSFAASRRWKASSTSSATSRLTSKKLTTSKTVFWQINTFSTIFILLAQVNFSGPWKSVCATLPQPLTQTFVAKLLISRVTKFWWIIFWDR